MDGNGLICIFEGGNVVALTHAGEVRWERNLAQDYGAIDSRHGLAASVEQSEGAAFVWVERKTDPYAMALDKRSGETLWKGARRRRHKLGQPAAGSHATRLAPGPQCGRQHRGARSHDR
jgi:outer membrane protein assembly factor BamB